VIREGTSSLTLLPIARAVLSLVLVCINSSTLIRESRDAAHPPKTEKGEAAMPCPFHLSPGVRS
jgi:hypothetical protein